MGIAETDYAAVEELLRAFLELVAENPDAAGEVLNKHEKWVGEMADLLRNLKRKHPGPVEDAVFHTEVERLHRLMIWLVNYLFKTPFTGNERVLLGNVELSEPKSAGARRTIRADSFFVIISEDGQPFSYHIECHQGEDDTIVLRIVEYDLMIALGNAKVSEIGVDVDLPNSAAILLRGLPHNPDHPNQWTYRIHSGNNVLEHKIRTIYLSETSIDDIFQHDLYALLPFYLFTHGARLKTLLEKEDGRQALLKEEAEVLDRLISARNLTDFEKLCLRELTSDVIGAVVKDSLLRGEMEEIMYPNTISLRSDQIGMPYYNQGRSEGRIEGRNEGRIEECVALSLEYGKSKEEVLDLLQKRFDLTQEQAVVAFEEYSEQASNVGDSIQPNSERSGSCTDNEGISSDVSKHD